MATKMNFPNRKDKRRQSALARRLKDIDIHNQIAVDQPELEAQAKVKVERAKSDVTALKAKLGLN